MAHRVEHEKIEAEQQLIKVLQLDLMAELERKMRTLTEGTRLADLLSSRSADMPSSAHLATLLRRISLVDKILTANARVRETLLWLRGNVTALSNHLARMNGST